MYMRITHAAVIDALVAALMTPPETIAEWIDEAWGNDSGNEYSHQNLAEAVSRQLRAALARVEGTR